MKIALITHHFPPNYFAGAEQYANRIAQGLQRSGHSVEVVAIESITDGSDNLSSVVDDYAGLKVHRLSFDIRNTPNPFEWSFRNPDLGRWVKGYLSDTCPDIVHINGGYLVGGSVVEAAQEVGIPIALTLHDFWFICPMITLLRTDGKVCAHPVEAARCVWCSLSQKRRFRYLNPWMNTMLGEAFVDLSRSERLTEWMGVKSDIQTIEDRRVYLKEILEKAALVISPSHFLMKKVEEYGLKTRRMVYLPFGLEWESTPDRSSGGEKAHREAGQPESQASQVRIGFLGQMVKHKGVHVLLDAFLRLRLKPGQVKLVLHGKLDAHSGYGRLLLQKAQKNPDIILAGPYPNARVSEILSDLDAIVVPSIWYENRPTVVVEAFASHTPVVASRIGGLAEMVKHDQTGLLFEPGSVSSLAEQLQRLIDEPGLLSRLCNSIEPVPDVEAEIGELVGLYEDILEEKGDQVIRNSD